LKPLIPQKVRFALTAPLRCYIQVGQDRRNGQWQAADQHGRGSERQIDKQIGRENPRNGSWRILAGILLAAEEELKTKASIQTREQTTTELRLHNRLARTQNKSIWLNYLTHSAGPSLRNRACVVGDCDRNRRVRFKLNADAVSRHKRKD